MGKVGSYFDCIEILFLEFVGIGSVLGLSIAKAISSSQLPFCLSSHANFFVPMIIFDSALSVTSACGNRWSILRLVFVRMATT